MRKHHKRWTALAGTTAVCLAGFGLLGGASAAADDDEGLRWPVIQQRASTYAIDGFEIGYLPAELERYGISAESATGKKGERASHIAWVQGPDATYGKVAILRDPDLTSLDVLRSQRYDHLEDASLERVEAESERQEAYVSESTGDYFFLQEEGVAVAAYLQPDKWDAEELAKFATSVRPQAAEVEEAADQSEDDPPSDEGAEEPAAEDPAEESPAGGAPAEEAPEEPAAEDPAAEDPAAEEPGAEEAPAAEEPAAEAPAAEDPEAEAPVEEAPAEEEPAAEDPAAGGEATEGESTEGAETAEAAPDAEDAAADTGAEDAAGSEGAADGTTEQNAESDAEGTETDAGEAAAGGDEGAEAATDGETVGIRLPEGATAADVRTCLAEEITGGELDKEMRETARDAEKFTGFWGKTAIADRRTAVDACIERLKADEWWYEEGAEKGDEEVGARYAGAWREAPWTLPAQRMGD
ncbi:hypothetical protein [Nocardiopsis suaedae]|uniref:Uncharacterized protein n=1 Tax=Nocardiopsis suaedae TaxID=3018444 RepID=A0ABT4TRD5_9ACTN|nr:hypothetical protein [Nocardiopsis suaedae]MDA2807239.1 hypothetical protein [Nocardiopsis suaedae]